MLSLLSAVTSTPRGGEPGGVSIGDDALFATVQVASLARGRFQVPDDTQTLLIEIGCSNRDTMDDQELPRMKEKAFLFSFEPLLDKYALLLAKGDARYNGRKNDQFQPLGHHHPRGLVLPIAVAPQNGVLPINVSQLSGCSSIVPFSSAGHEYKLMGSDACRSVAETRLVPSITLAKLLRLMPPLLPIHMLKLDAQGVDFALIKSTPPVLLERVRSLHLEAINDETRNGRPCPTLYDGQPRISEVKAYLHSIGFKFAGMERPGWMGPLKCEGTVKFHRQ